MTPFLPGDIAGFPAAEDQVHVVLEETCSEDAERRVRSGAVDLPVVAEGPDLTGLWR